MGPFGCFDVNSDAKTRPSRTPEPTPSTQTALIDSITFEPNPFGSPVPQPEDLSLDLGELFEFNLDPSFLDLEHCDMSDFPDPFQIDGVLYPLQRDEAADNHRSERQSSGIIATLDTTNPNSGTCTPKSDTRNRQEGSPDVMVDAETLLSHYDLQVASQLVPIPFCRKCPWKTLNLTYAIDTLANIRFLRKNRPNNACLANLYGVLACSAYHKGSNPTLNPLRDHWEEIALQSCRLSKLYLKRSIKSELRGAGKVKYKHQMTAILSLLAFALMTGNQEDARCFLLDAENLIRLRGMAKRHISQRVRLLHHVYTWMRVLGESTFLLHDYRNYHSVPDMLKLYELAPSERDVLAILSNSHSSSTSQNGPSDPLLYLHDLADGNLEPAKDPNAPKSSDDIYLAVYGVPEIWLRLLAHTTRLANIKDVLEAREDEFERASLLNSLRNRSDQLEDVICSFLPDDSTHTGLPGTEKLKDLLRRYSNHPTVHVHMLDALHYALAIYFYRRVRNVNRRVLQGLVDGVIKSLTAFSTATTATSCAEPGRARNVGTPWPAFIAGCEACSAVQRKVLGDWIQHGLLTYGSYGFRAAKDMMDVLWNERDEEATKSPEDLLASGRTHQSSWIGLSKEHQLWLMLC
ncbi:hypothetical protein ABEF95_002813 [Exophiala dermatitidis]